MNSSQMKNTSLLLGIAGMSYGIVRAWTSSSSLGAASAGGRFSISSPGITGNGLGVPALSPVVLASHYGLFSVLMNDPYFWLGIAFISTPYVFAFASRLATRGVTTSAIPHPSTYVLCRNCRQPKAASSTDCPYCGAYQPKAGPRHESSSAPSYEGVGNELRYPTAGIGTAHRPRK